MISETANSRMRNALTKGSIILLANLLLLFAAYVLLLVTSKLISVLVIFEIVFMALFYPLFWLYAGTKAKSEGRHNFSCGILIGLIGILPNLVLWFVFRVIEVLPLYHTPPVIFLDLFMSGSLLMPFILAYGFTARQPLKTGC